MQKENYFINLLSDITRVLVKLYFLGHLNEGNDNWTSFIKKKLLLYLNANYSRGKSILLTDDPKYDFWHFFFGNVSNYIGSITNIVQAIEGSWLAIRLIRKKNGILPYQFNVSVIPH